MAQFGRPSSDVSFYGNGTPVDSAGNRYQNIDEATASDTDYNYTQDNPNGSSEHLLDFGAVSDPIVHTGHVVRFRYVTIDGGVPGGGGSTVSLTVDVYQGATLIALTTIANFDTGSWTDGSFTLTEGEAANITDYTDLRLRFNYSGGGGSPANRRGVGISWAEMEIPDAPDPPDTVLKDSIGRGMIPWAR